MSRMFYRGAEIDEPDHYADMHEADAAPSAEWLASVKALVKGRIDATAERLRNTMITPGSGQAMEYQDVYAEAVEAEAALKTDPAAKLDPASFPMLAATPGVDIAGAARAVLAAYDAYKAAGAVIRAARLRGKMTVDAAGTVAEIEAAAAGIDWPKLAT